MKRKQIIGAMALLAMIACKDRPAGNTDQMAENFVEGTAQEEWIVLFDGTSMGAWKGYGIDEMPPHWSIEEGALVFSPPADRPRGQSYNLVTRQEFSDFVLSLEWKVAEGGNSGIFWGVKEDLGFGQPYETGPEIQVLDNERHPDAKNGTTHQAGALYDLVAPAKDVTRTAGEWNRCEITVNYSEHAGKVVLNGEEILTFPLANEAWEAMVAGSKFAGWKGFGAFPTGKIGLQDHGDMVAFRNIKIKSL